MVKEIPGYYYDTEKQKYFKIQPNHAVPSAVKHSRQVINAQKASDKRRKLNDSHHKRRLRETLQSSKVLANPLLGRLGLGRLGGHLPRDRSNKTVEIGAYYGASLSPVALIDGAGLSSDFSHFNKFAIDHEGDIFSAWQSSRGYNYVYHNAYIPLVRGVPAGPYQSASYLEVARTEDRVNSILVTPASNPLIVWATGTGKIQLIRRYPSEEADVYGRRRFTPAFNPADSERFYNGLRSCGFNECDVWELATSPSGSRVGIAYTGLREISNFHASPVDFYGINGSMTVSFKDENVLLGGMGSGHVKLRDVRAPQTIVRLQHPDGVSAVRAIGDSGNSVLVRGFNTMQVYDLRFDSPTTALAVNGKGKSIPALSRPYMTFIAGAGVGASGVAGFSSYTIDRYGMGFDYDATLGLIATAHSTPVTGNHVSLFSARTGKLVSSPLNRHAFETPVMDLKFASLHCPLGGGGGVSQGENNEPKSIVLANGGVIEEWSCQGLGYENELQE